MVSQVRKARSIFFKWQIWTCLVPHQAKLDVSFSNSQTWVSNPITHALRFVPHSPQHPQPKRTATQVPPGSHPLARGVPPSTYLEWVQGLVPESELEWALGSELESEPEWALESELE